MDLDEINASWFFSGNLIDELKKKLIDRDISLVLVILILGDWLEGNQ